MADTSETQPNDEQIEAMRQQVAAYDAEKAAEAVAAENARLLAIRTFCASDAYKTLAEGITAIVSQYGLDPNIAPHLDCLNIGLTNLAGIVGPLPMDASAPTNVA